MQQNNKQPGLYITVIGQDGGGKSTLAKNLNIKLHEDYSHLKIVTTREPGGTPEAERLREIVKTQKLTPFKEAEIFANARASSLSEVVRPALSEGKVVISDRCYLCSLAYQGIAKGLGLLTVEELNKSAVQDAHPDVVIWLDVGYEAAKERLSKTNKDKFDSEGEYFFYLVEMGYREILQIWQREHPGMKIIRIKDLEGKLSPDEVLKTTLKELEPLIWKWEGIEGNSKNSERKS